MATAPSLPALYRVFLFILLLACLSATPSFACAAGAAQSLRVYSWVNYFPPWLLEAFTAKTGIPVHVTFFADNNDLYRKLKHESMLVAYDVVTPSGEMVQRLASEKLLLPLNKKKILHASDLDPWFNTLPYDLGNNYSLPLFWGVMGLLVDKKVIPPEVEARIQSYNDLWLPEVRGKVVLLNDWRSAMSAMLLSLGYSVNETSPARLEEAMKKLESLAPAVVLYDTVDQQETMLGMSTGLALSWGVERLTVNVPGSRFHFIFPREGSPMWVDAMAVPKNSAMPDAAFALINFVLQPENLARLSTETGYAIAGKKAQALVPESLRNNSAVYPPRAMRHTLEVETMLPPDTAAAMEKRWQKMKNSVERYP